MAVLVDKRRWKSTLAILDTGAGSNLIKQSFVSTACWSSAKQVQAVWPRSAGSSPLKVIWIRTTELQIVQLQEKVWFLVYPEPASRLILETAFIRKYVEVFSPNTGLSTPSRFSLIPIVNETRRNHIVTILVMFSAKENRNPTDEHSYMAAW